MYKAPIDMMQILPDDMTVASYKTKYYLDKWTPLFIGKLGKVGIDEVISSTMLHTLLTFKDFDNDEHLERYIKNVALSYNNRTLNNTVEYEDYLAVDASPRQPELVNTMDPALIATLLSYAKDLKQLYTVLQTPTADASAYVFIDETLRDVVREQLEEGTFDMKGLLALLYALLPQINLIAEGISDENYVLRMEPVSYTVGKVKDKTKDKLKDVKKVDVYEIMEALSSTSPRIVAKKSTDFSVPQTSCVELEGRRYYVASNGRVTTDLNKWLTANVESMACKIVESLAGVYNYIGEDTREVVYAGMFYFKQQGETSLHEVELEVYNKRYKLPIEGCDKG